MNQKYKKYASLFTSQVKLMHPIGN